MIRDSAAFGRKIRTVDHVLSFSEQKTVRGERFDRCQPAFDATQTGVESNIDQLEVTQENAKLAHKRADTLQEVADKHAKDLLESRTKVEEQTKTIEQLANAVLKREKELNENKRVLIMQEEELKAVEKRERKRGTFEREGERDER